MLTLDEFRATRVKLIDVPEIGLEGPGYVYDQVCFINLDENNEPFLVIYNEQWIEDLAELERILYEEFYTVEINAG